MKFYCTYCDYYSRDYAGKHNGGEVFTGARRQVVKHADEHPIGDPRDMVAPMSDREAYA